MTTTSVVFVNQPRTILGSLTTTFTPPASCANVCLATGSSGPEYRYGRDGWRAQSCLSASVNGVIDATQCWPPTTAGAVYPFPPFSGWGFYSPGIVCPHGYTSACTATAKGSAQWPVQYALVEGETAVGCCPTDYTCVNSGTAGASCVLTATSTVMTVATCDAEARMISFLQTYPLTTVLIIPPETPTLTGVDVPATSTATTTVRIETITASAAMIQINWQSTDLVTTPTSTLSTPPELITTVNENSKGTVTTGSIIGITIGCVVALLVACAIAWFLLRRRRRRKLQAGTERYKEHWKPPQLQQSNGKSVPVELDSPTKAIEMAGADVMSK